MQAVHITRALGALAVSLFVGLVFCSPGQALAADDAGAVPAVEVSGAEYLKGVKRIAITQFEVQFVTQHIGSAAFSGTSGFGKTAMTTELRSVDAGQMQSIVDTYYDRAVAEFAAAGIEVVGLPQLEANPDFQNLKGKAYPAPFTQAPINRDGLSIKGTFYSAHGLPIYFMKDRAETEGRGKGRVNYLEVGTLMSNGFKVSYIEAYERAISKAFGAHVLRVRMTVPFGEMSASGGLFTSAASVSLKAGLRLDAVASRYEVLEGGSNIARIGLKSDLGLAVPVGRIDETDRNRPFYVVDGAEYVDVVGRQLLVAHKAFQAAMLAGR